MTSKKWGYERKGKVFVFMLATVSLLITTREYEMKWTDRMWHIVSTRCDQIFLCDRALPVALQQAKMLENRKFYISLSL